MSSTTSEVSSRSSVATGVPTNYLECYNVLYSAGELHKPGHRTWLDGIVSYTTLNQKLILRSSRGEVIEETYKSPLPQGCPTAQTIKQEEVPSPSFPAGVSFSITGSYTIEVVKLRSIHAKTLGRSNLREAEKRKKKDEQIAKILKDTPDILPTVLKRPRLQDERGVDAADGRTPARTLMSVGTTARREGDGEGHSPPISSTSTSNSSLITPSRCRVVGLSRAPKRPTVGLARAPKQPRS